MSDVAWSDRIVDYAEDVRYRGPLVNPTHVAECVNPACGDKLRVELIVSVGRMARIAFQASGCCLSRAAAAILAEDVDGLPVGYARLISDAEMIALVGVGGTSPRRACALLPLVALRKALREGGHR